MGKLKVGIAGFGRSGCEIHGEFFKEDDRFEVVAVSDGLGLWCRANGIPIASAKVPSVLSAAWAREFRLQAADMRRCEREADAPLA